MRVRRTWMSCAQRNELWARWRAGESLTDIGHALARGSGRIYTIVTAEGGVAPAPRRRSRLALTMAEREDISRGLASGMSVRALARQLKRAPSTGAGRFADTAGPETIAPRRRTDGRGRAADGRSGVAWRPARRCGARWPRSWACNGRRSKLRAGFGRRVRAILICRCRTRRSIARCSCRAAAR